MAGYKVVIYVQIGEPEQTICHNMPPFIELLMLNISMAEGGRFCPLQRRNNSKPFSALKHSVN
ncbi:hypothetical protein imdm_1604 [gamma proteobacterium IMCC2047]|nr:hypothetical protein imdm_1604 [gamma proteobacterium IMCC2047]